MSIGIITAFILYLGFMLSVGMFFYKKTTNLSDYILGGRQLNSWVTSLSAQASDMSGWLLLGLPGYAYIAGLEAGWIALGLALGTYFNWKFVAKRLRKYTQVSGNSLTLPDYFENRFRDDTKALRIISAVFILIFFLFYTASGFVAGGKLFNTVFGIPYTLALTIGVLVIISYTFLGGFMAVCWTDFFQGMLMFVAILVVPVSAVFFIGGPAVTLDTLVSNHPELLNPFNSSDGKPLTLIAIISLLAWGLGYFGQPHILVRFMAIKSSKQISRSRLIAMIWVVVSLVAADSQLLVTASAISGDFYKALFRTNAEEKELVWVSRFTVIGVAIIAFLLALDPKSSVLDLVEYAWAGFGATFGPTILLSLFWKRMTRSGAIAGVVAGGVMTIVWKQLSGGIFDLYEIVPGFAVSMIFIVVISLIDKVPTMEISNEFDSVAKADV